MLNVQTISNCYTDHPINICRMHLQNYIIYELHKYPGTILAKKRLTLTKDGAFREDIELLLYNLALVYDKSHIETALRSLKMYNYCRKYLKVG